jgi:PTH1 family peptidyl-tRNA hydrolase
MKLPIFSKNREHGDAPAFLVAGLGNPGEEYANTRHNVGFMAVNRFIAAHQLSKQRRRYGGRWREGDIDGLGVATLMPQTYMNRSGEAVQLAASRKHIQPENIIIIHDDMDFPFGTIRVRQGGGSGGHNGLDSVTRKLGTSDYIRVRIGIGRPGDEEIDVRDWVLSAFVDDEEEQLLEVIDSAAECIQVIIKEGIEAAMNRFNRRDEG